MHSRSYTGRRASENKLTAYTWRHSNTCKCYCQKLLHYLLSNNIFASSQYDFILRRSTSTQLMSILKNGIIFYDSLQ